MDRWNERSKSYHSGRPSTHLDPIISMMIIWVRLSSAYHHNYRHNELSSFFESPHPTPNNSIKCYIYYIVLKFQAGAYGLGLLEINFNGQDQCWNDQCKPIDQGCIWPTTMVADRPHIILDHENHVYVIVTTKLYLSGPGIFSFVYY